MPNNLSEYQRSYHKKLKCDFGVICAGRSQAWIRKICGQANENRVEIASFFLEQPQLNKILSFNKKIDYPIKGVSKPACRKCSSKVKAYLTRLFFITTNE